MQIAIALREPRFRRQTRLSRACRAHLERSLARHQPVIQQLDLRLEAPPGRGGGTAAVLVCRLGDGSIHRVRSLGPRPWLAAARAAEAARHALDRYATGRRQRKRQAARRLRRAA